jgi:cytochrome P450
VLIKRLVWVYALHHPSVIKEVLKSPKNDVVYSLLTPWIGNGLLVSSGKKWWRNRRLLTPAFHYETLKPYVSVYNSCVEVMLRKWTACAEEQKPVRVFKTVGLLSLDVVLQCAFSYQSDCQLEGREGLDYVKAVYRMSELVVLRSLSLYTYVGGVYWLTPNGREMTRCCKVVHDFSEQVIRKRKGEKAITKDARDPHRKCMDFLDILLMAQDEDGRGLTDLEIRDEADTFMFGGHDTITSGMSWTLYCLAKHPTHQDKIREEVRSVLMGREWLEYDDLKDLNYTTWCIKEAMRLYPPAYSVLKRLNEDTLLDDVMIPKGSKIAISINNLHHNPEVWEQPDEYNPLRFHPSNAVDRNPYAYMPFSAGYRNCIGQNFALNEERVVIAMLCHRFQFSLVASHKVEMMPTLILKTRNDILLEVKLSH